MKSMKSDPASVLPPVTSTSLTRRLIPHPRRRFNRCDYDENLSSSLLAKTNEKKTMTMIVMLARIMIMMITMMMMTMKVHPWVYRWREGCDRRMGILIGCNHRVHLRLAVITVKCDH